MVDYQTVDYRAYIKYQDKYLKVLGYLSNIITTYLVIIHIK